VNDPLDIVLLRHLATRLGDATRPRTQDARLRAAGQEQPRLAYSEAFFDAYRRLVCAAIPARLVRAFGWRAFHMLEADETRRRTVADPALWADVPARFTSRGADALWRLLAEQPPSRRGCTEWDALVALMAWPREAGEVFTEAWLHRYHIRWDLLVMRGWGDYEVSREFKQWSTRELRQYGFELKLAVEDDRRNVEMFRSEGIPCIYFHSGYYD